MHMRIIVICEFASSSCNYYGSWGEQVQTSSQELVYSRTASITTHTVQYC